MKWAEETYFSLRRGKLWPILEQRITQGSLSPFSLDTLLCSPLPRSSAMLLRALDRKKASQPLGSYEWSGIICWHKNPVRQVNMTLLVAYTLHIQFSSVTQSCPTLHNPMDCSTPSLPIHHQLPEFTQTHVHWVGDAIQPSHPLSSPFPPAFNLPWHQGLFKWVSSSHQVAKVLEFQLQHQSFQWIFRTDFL